MVEEYKICKLDEESGVEEAIMELYDFKITGRNSRYTNLVLPLATFKGKGKENYITLSGDFTNIELIRGKNYKIMFYKNSKMLVQIENA
jgi:hypothetical protein